VDRIKKHHGEKVQAEGEDLEKGNLFATGLVAGGALMGVIFAFLKISPRTIAFLDKLSVEAWMRGGMGETGYFLLGFAFFAVMGYALYRAGVSKQKMEL
jgi:hypothetical protein